MSKDKPKKVTSPKSGVNLVEIANRHSRRLGGGKLAGGYRDPRDKIKPAPSPKP